MPIIGKMLKFIPTMVKEINWQLNWQYLTLLLIAID